jgi:GH25 family lysozyme M1 (1,4-beta-N-acetylmuramidase)
MSGRRPNSDSGEPDLWSNGSVFMGSKEPISVDPSPQIPLQQTTGNWEEAVNIANPVFGVDVHPEYQKGFDFERAKAQGYEYAFIKASEGPYRDRTTYVPAGFKEFYNRAKASGIIVGLYHFLIESDGDDPRRGGRIQAEHFLRTINSVGGTNGKLLSVDFEHYSDKYPWLRPSNATLKSFISSLRLRIGKHPIILYSSRGFGNGGDPSGNFARYGADVAWDAMYLNMQPHDRPRDHYEAIKDRGWGKPWGNVSPMFWQFTSGGLVSGQNIDVHLATSCVTGEPGLNNDFTIAQSHDGGYFTHRIPREAIWG